MLPSLPATDLATFNASTNAQSSDYTATSTNYLLLLTLPILLPTNGACIILDGNVRLTLPTQDTYCTIVMIR